MSSLRRGLWGASIALLSALMGAMPAAANPKLTVLYQATADDGNSAGSLDQPLSVAGGGVIVEAQGPLGSAGIILLLTPSGSGQYTRTVLHDFTDPCSSDGGYPSGRLAADKHGNVWGMTNDSCGVPGGTVFELVRPPKGGSWTYKEVLQMPTTFY